METYIPKHVCSRKINFEVTDGIITACEFIGGCAGNTQGISALIKGMKIDEAIKRLEGIECRMGTSCPDQLSKALKEYKLKMQSNI